MILFKKTGILGINARNLLYIKPYNDKKAILFADNKLKTKAFLSTRGIPVPKLYAVIHNKETLKNFDFSKLPSSFVIKPNLGFGGEGIIPIAQHQKDYWLTGGGEKYTKEDFTRHIQDILDGRYAISAENDSAFFEQLIITDDVIGKYCYKGLPDLRIVVHNLIPVMAMLRLPTRESRGKANLHQGAIGVGLDISKGTATHAFYKNRIIKEIPDVGSISGLKIPYWDDILMIAVKAQLVTNLGYMAADIAIDKNTGPILLEVNARAGLSVQIANLAPLRRRLERIKGLKVTTPEKGIRIAKDMFGRAPEKRIPVSEVKPVISLEENIEIILKDRIQKMTAYIDTGIERSALDLDFAYENQLIPSEDFNEEKSTLKLKFSLGGKRIQTIVDIKPVQNHGQKMVIGLRDLDGFLIAPKIAKKTTLSDINGASIQKPTLDFQEIDRKLCEIENNMKLLYYLRPLNLDEEVEKFMQNFHYNPQFIYQDLQFNAFELKTELQKIQFDNSPLGILFQKKAQEIENKIELLENRGTQDFTAKVLDLFGKPSVDLLSMCDQVLKDKPSEESAEIQNIFDVKAKKIFLKTLQNYGLKNWKVKIKEGLVANCIAGKKNRVFIKKGAHFSERRIKNLIIHEIETHVLTAENGKNQPYCLFNRGFAGYLETQEGLALYNVKQHGHESESDRFYIAALAKASDLALNMSFSEVFANLKDIGLSEEKALKATLKVKRGFTDTKNPGAFTKDHLYFKGEKQVETFIEQGGDIKVLYCGKFNLDDVQIIQKIPELKAPKVLPAWIK